MHPKYKKSEIVKGVLDFIKEAPFEGVGHEVASHLRTLNKDKESDQTVYVYTAKKLNPETEQEFIKAIKKLTGRDAQIKEIVNPALLGGFKIKIGDWVYDATVRNQLNTIKNNLYEVA